MLIRASLLSERFSKREPAAIRIFSLACCLDHHDASATQLTDKIPRVRPRKHDDQVDSTAQFLDWFKRPFPNQGICEYYRQLALEAVQCRNRNPPHPIRPPAPWNGLPRKAKRLEQWRFRAPFAIYAASPRVYSLTAPGGAAPPRRQLSSRRPRGRACGRIRASRAPARARRGGPSMPKPARRRDQVRSRPSSCRSPS
jgi:hypothetical protein